MSNPIFIVGSPRSGTSYLSRALGLAEDSCYLGESAIFCLAGARSDFRTYMETMNPAQLFPYHSSMMRMLSITDNMRRRNRVRDAVEHLFLMSKIESYDLNRSDTLYKARGIRLSMTEQAELDATAYELSRTLCSEGIFAFARDYINAYSIRRGCSNVIEKTPAHLRFLPLIHEIFPNAMVVLIRRKKNECHDSYFRTFGRGLGGLRYLPVNISKRIVWKLLEADVQREKWAMMQSWIKKVEFEDLVKQPKKLMRELTDWLGLEYNFEKYGSLFPEDMTTAAQMVRKSESG